MEARSLPVMLLAAASAVACSASSYPPSTDSCKVDSDCAIDDVARDCCGHLCGPQPPWVAIDTRSRDALIEARHARCDGKRLDCPQATCPAPPDCRATPRAVCRAGRCIARVDLVEACGTGDCDAQCGAQPAASPPGKEAMCAAALEDAWARCCCHAMGTPAELCDRGGRTVPDECRQASQP